MPISWASRPVDLNAQRPVGAAGAGSSAAGAGYRPQSTCPRVLSRHQISSISTSTPASISTPTTASSGSTPGLTPILTPISTPASFTSPSFACSPPIPHSLPRRSHSNTRLGIRRERSLDGFHTSQRAMTRMTPPLPSSPAPLGLSFARLASVSSPQSRPQVPNRIQSQGVIKIGSRERGDTVRTNDVGPPPGTTMTTATANANNTRPALRSLPFKSPTITPIISDPEPHPSVKMLNPTSTIKLPPPRSPMATAFAASPAIIGGVITRPTLIGPRSIGAKQKLQLSLQIPAIPLLGPDQQDEQEKNGKPQLPALKLVTDTVLLPTTTNSSPSIKLSPSPSSPSVLSYVSHSTPHSPTSPSPTPKQHFLTSSPVQLSPTHSSLFSADSKIHLHPLSLSSPISGTTSGSSVRTSVGGWVMGGTAGGGGVSPGGRSVKSLGGRSVNSLRGRRARSVRSVRSTRSTRSVRSNRSRRSTKINIPVSLPSPDLDTSVTTPTPMYNTGAYAYHLDILGDHVGEYVGDGGGDGEGEGNGFGYGYVEDGWGTARSPSPMRYARPDSRGNLRSDNEEDGERVVVGVYGDKNTTGDESAASSEVEFADVDGDSDDSDDDSLFERRVRRGRRSRRWRVDRARGSVRTTTTDNTPSLTTSSPSISLSLPQYALSQGLDSHNSSHSSSHSNPSASSPLSSSSSTKSYSNPYSTRKDRKRARKTQLRSFRHSYRMPPVVLLEEEDRGRGEEKDGEKQERGKNNRNRTSSPVVMMSIIPFRRKTPPPPGGGGEEQAAVDSTNASMKKKKKEGKKSKDKEKEKDGKKSQSQARASTISRKQTKSLFNSVSASMSATYSQSGSTTVPSVPQSSSVPPHSYPQSQSESGSTCNTRASSVERGRKSIASTTAKTRKKFAEAVSSALEEVTSRGRAGSGSLPGKSKSITPFSSGSSYLAPAVAVFDEMEVLDIVRLPEDGSGGDGNGDVDLDLESGVGERDEDVSVEVEAKAGMMLRTAIKNDDDGDGVVGTTSSSLLELDRFSTVYLSDGGKITASTVPIPSIPRHSLHQKQNEKEDPWLSASRRGSSLGRDGAIARPSSAGNRHTRNITNNSSFQVQPACTTGISWGLPVSRPPQPFISRSIVVRPPLPFSAPLGYMTDSTKDESGGGGGSRPPFVVNTAASRPTPPYSAPPVVSKAAGVETD